MSEKDIVRGCRERAGGVKQAGAERGGTAGEGTYAEKEKARGEGLWSTNEPIHGLRAENLDAFLERHGEDLISEPRPFAAYMRQKLREKGLLQQDVFLAADLSENFGYKLVAEEKHTRQRDVILRLCFAGRFRPEEVQEALLRYGMAPLWWRFPRDAILLAAFASEIYDLQAVNRLLEQHGQKPLLRGYA